MKIVTERELRRTIAGRWLNRLGRADARRLREAEQLQALGDDPTREQIASVIGHDRAYSMLRIVCSECERDVAGVAEVDADSDYMESALICLDCLQEAVKRLQETKP